ncbi:MAG: cation transporter [Planctomycetes bacterium]|nr:cation transporter [Planctomycetota bacterium]
MAMRELYRQSRKAAIWGIGISLLLGGAKLLGGHFGHSMALFSDAIHSLGDAVVFLGVLAALVWSEQPPDQEHPYGHTRAEALAGFSVAFILILSALWVLWEALRSLQEPPEELKNYTLWIAGISAVLKEGMYQYSIRVARQTRSRAIEASAWDHRMDAATSFGVLLALLLVQWGGPSFHAADHVAAVGVGLVILLGGSRLFWNNLQELMDRQAQPEILQAVRREALTVPGVKGVEKLLVRKTGMEYLVDIHVEVDPEITVREGHAIAHAVKDHVQAQIGSIRDLLVHIEPAGGPQTMIKRD